MQKNPVKAIREFCLDCCGDSAADVKGCKYCDGNGGRYIDVASENPYWERICKLSERQRAKGEELIDALMYCEWIKDKLKTITGKDGKDE